MKKILFLLVIVVMVVGLVACANARESAVENIIENIIEKESGEKIDIDIDEGGDSVTIKTEEGEVTFESDEGGMPWPSDKLPAGFPMLNGVTVVSVIDVGTGILIYFEDCDENTADAYIDQIKASGWNISVEVETGDMRSIIADNDNDEFLQFSWDSVYKSGSVAYGKNN